MQLENELRAVKKQKTSAASAQQTTLSAFAGSSKAPAAAPERDAKADAKLVKTRTKSLFDQYVSSPPSTATASRL